MAKISDPRRTSGASKGPMGYPGVFKGQMPAESLTRPRFNVNPIYPQGNQPRQGAWAASRYSKQMSMVHYKSTNTKTSGTSRLYVFTPSARLRLSLVLVPECSNGAANGFQGEISESFNTPGNLAIGALLYSGTINPETGTYSTIAQILPSGPSPVLQPIPFGWEADTAASVIRVSAIVSNLDFSGVGIPAALDINLRLIATWEPTVEMPDAELQQLFQKCSISGTTLEMLLTP